jgi:drug/metabolite transporter (DMT)-like permease
MSYTFWIYALCGAAGAFTYSFPLFLKGLGKKPPSAHGGKYLGFAVFVGAIFAAVFTRIVGHHFPWTVEPEPWPLALVIGLCSNPVVPVIVSKAKGWAETFEGVK